MFFCFFFWSVGPINELQEIIVCLFCVLWPSGCVSNYGANLECAQCALALLLPLSRSFMRSVSHSHAPLTGPSACGLPGRHTSRDPSPTVVPPVLGRSITPRKEGINSLHVNILLWIILRCSWPPLPFCSPAVTGSSDRKIQNKKTSSAAAVISSTLEPSASDSLTHRHPACCFLQSDPAYWASTQSSCWPWIFA